ncbi:hypothetical protein BOX15_Mlig011387g1 [Macrostomum lignano]|nr:hypothetical protein BOX15_Mlig011387g1 [Macrostomum lignano]
MEENGEDASEYQFEIETRDGDNARLNDSKKEDPPTTIESDIYSTDVVDYVDDVQEESGVENLSEKVATEEDGDNDSMADAHLASQQDEEPQLQESGNASSIAKDEDKQQEDESASAAEVHSNAIVSKPVSTTAAEEASLEVHVEQTDDLDEDLAKHQRLSLSSAAKKSQQAHKWASKSNGSASGQSSAASKSNAVPASKAEAASPSQISSRSATITAASLSVSISEALAVIISLLSSRSSLAGQPWPGLAAAEQLVA